MRSNNKLLQLAGLALAAAGLTACDNVDEADRFIPVPRPEGDRVVLVQEFTGLWCTNCPSGAAVVHQMQTAFPGRVISVNMHPKGDALCKPLMGLDLSNELSRTYYLYWKPVGFPSAIINGVGPYKEYTQWANYITAALDTSTPVLLDLEPTFDPATRTLSCDYDLTFINPMHESVGIQLWVVENDIHGKQISGGRPVDYVHSHVLRATLNGDWGEELGNEFQFMQTVTGSGSCELDKSWVAENCAVVGFLFRTSDKYVYQAAEKDVTLP